MSPKSVYHIQYTTQIWERIAFKIPSTGFIIKDWLLLPAWIAVWVKGWGEGAVVLANINQSHLKMFNRVLNGISSKSGNSKTHAYVRTYTHTYKHTHRVRHRPQQQKRKKADLDTTRTKRGQSATVETWTPVEGSKALEEDWCFTNTQGQKNNNKKTRMDQKH